MLRQDASKTATEGSSRTRGIYSSIVNQMGWVVFSVGALVLLSWFFDIEAGKSLSPAFESMKFNTALCFCACGFILRRKSQPATASPSDPVTMLLAVFVLGIASLTLLEYASGWQLGIDNLIITDKATPLENLPGRMSSGTALCFTMIGAGWLVTALPVRHTTLIMQVLALAVILVSGAALIGYVFGIQQFKPLMFSSMALHTAALFVLSGTGMLLVTPQEGLVRPAASPYAGGSALRRLLPYIIMTPILTSWLSLQGVSAGFYAEAFGFALSSLSSVLVLSCLVWLGADALNREEERYRLTIDSSPVATIMIDKEGIIRTANRLAHALFRYQASQLLGRTLESLIPDRFRMNHAGYQYEYMRKAEPRMIGEGRELFALRRDGTEFRAEVALSPAQNADSCYFMAVIVDITERVEAQQQILRLNRMHKVLSSINSLIIRLPTRETLCAETSRIAVEEGNLSAAVFVEHNTKTGQLKVFSAYAGGKIIEAKQLSGTETDAIRECLRTHRTVLRDDKANPLSNGKPLSLISPGVQALAAFPLTSPEHSLEAAMVLYQDEPFLFDQPDMKLLHELAGDVAFAIANLDRRQQFNYMTYFDSITQLPNRLLLADRLQQALLQADNNQGVVSIVYMDIDRFKQVNDSLGHTHGDTVLRTVAQRINACVGKADTASRWGGDEFVILLPGQGAAEASLVATCITGALLSVIELVGGQELFVSCSMGIAEYPRNGRDMDTLINSAATAMSDIKAQGGNDYRPSKVDTNDILDGDLALETSLRHALRLEQFQLYLQPQINIASRQVVGMEALVRWLHPTQGVISPDRFIPMAEKTGLIIPLGEWVLREACRLGATMPTLTVAVNLSARQFHQGNLVDVIRQILDETAMPACNLELEITESALMYDVESAIAKMEQFIALGARISLDDFGTGYSSLSYLKRFPIHTLKIDQSFIAQLTTDTGSEVIVNTVIDMAHGLGLNVIAEGVETEAQLAMLRARGCDQAQGYLFARPVPYQEVVDKVQLIT